ncbi:MAG: hypothetical protein IKY22_08920, partial [Bacteroidales bacterium]|nr:hypothetical protein [Bacteroidales bacterium]
MQSSSTKFAHCGTSIKQEQQGVCSAIQKITHTSPYRGSGGIAKHLMLLWLLAFTLVGSVAFGQVTYTYTSSGTHTVSEGVNYVIIEAIGGGGAGGSVSNGKRPAGGGGGGAYSRVQVDVSDVLGTSRQISYNVGAGGTAGTNNRDGGITTVSFGGYRLTANGGNGAAAVTGTTVGNGANGGDSVSNAISGTGISNYHSYAGGKGGNGQYNDYSTTSRYSGGGGGAAGSNGAGNAASGRSGGSAQSPGGYGANGLTQNSPGAAGGNYGGGGSGAYYYGSSNGNYTGGNGASGVVIITECYSTNTNGANSDIVSRGSNITSMEVDVVANDFIPCPNNYTIEIIGDNGQPITTSNSSPIRPTDDGKKVLVTFPGTYESANTVFQYHIKCGTGESATTTNTATVVIQNSTVVANLGCPTALESTTEIDRTIEHYKFKTPKIIGKGGEYIKYMSLAFTNVPDIDNAGVYKFEVQSDSGFTVTNNEIREIGTDNISTKIGDIIDLGSFMFACHFNVGNGITFEKAEKLIKAIHVSIPESNTNDFVGVALEISTNYDSRNIIYNAENGHYYEYVAGTVTWQNAYNAAKNTTYLGMQGYLATITSLAENRFMTALVSEPGWLGGTRWPLSGGDGTQYYENFGSTNDLHSYWYWACGPEKEQKFMWQAAACPNGFYPNPDLTVANLLEADDWERLAFNGTNECSDRTGTRYCYEGTAAQDSALLWWYRKYMSDNNCYFNWGIGHSDATGGPEPNSASGEYCLSILSTKGKGCSFYGTEFAKYSWNDLANSPSGDWSATGYIIEYGDLVTGNSFTPLHDGAKCRSIVGLRKETITATVTGTEIQCRGGKDSLAVSISFTGGMAPYEFDIYVGNTYVKSYTTNGATTIYLPIEQNAKTYTIRDFTSGTITVGGCNVTAATFVIQGGSGEGKNEIKVPAAFSYKISKTAEECGKIGLKVKLSGGDATQYPLTVALSSFVDPITISVAGDSAIFTKTEGLTGGSYTVTITPANNKGCVKDTVFSLVVDNVTFTAGSIEGSGAVCEGATPTIGAADADGNGTLQYRWYQSINGEPATLITDATDETYTPSDLTAGTYEYIRKVKDPCNTNDPNADPDGFVSSGSYILTVNPKPTNVTASGPSEDICGGGSITLTGSADGDGLSYKWTKEGVEKGSDITYTIYPAYQSHSGTYVFTVTNTYGCSADASVDNIRVLTDPIEVAITLTDANGNLTVPATVCEGSSVTLSACYNVTANAENTGNTENTEDVTPPTYTYTLKNGNTTISTQTTNGVYNPTLENLEPGTYTLNVASESESCVKPYTVLTVYPKPVVSISPETATICAGGSTELSAEVTNASGEGVTVSYVWYKGGTGESNVISDQTSNSLQLSSLTAGQHSYYVKANVTYGEGASAVVCTSEISGPYTVEVYEAFTVSEITGAETHCLHDTENLSLSVTAAGGHNTTYAWSYRLNNGESVALESTSNTVNVLTNAAGTYVYSVVVSNDCGEDVTKNFTVTVYTQETVSLASSTTETVCPRAEVTLTATAGAGDENYRYAWYTVSNGTATQIEGATESILRVTPESTTTYRVVVSDGCATTTEATSEDVTVTVY